MTVFYRHTSGMALIVMLAGLIHIACFKTDRANPLDSAIDPFFLPVVLEPSGGEQWFPGQEKEIRWRPATRGVDTEVAIQLIVGPDTLLIAEQVDNKGSYRWTVPDMPSPSCRIRIAGRGGAGVSAQHFSIRPLPTLEKLATGAGNGWAPSALREKVLFESDHAQPGNVDIWLYNRATHLLSRFTNEPEFDGEVSWFKPAGKVFIYTSGTGLNKNIWIRVTEGPFANTFQLTTAGGEKATWQNTDELERLAFAFLRPIPSNTDFKQIFAATLNTPISGLPVIATPLTLASGPTPLNSSGFEARNIIYSLSWLFKNGVNSFFFTSGTATRQVNRIAFPGQTYGRASVNPFALPLSRDVDQARFSPSGDWITFSSEGDIWVAPVSGIVAYPLTFGPEIDSEPDWATESEIVFARKTNIVTPPDLWTVQVPDPP